jgi:hypothetical protein
MIGLGFSMLMMLCGGGTRRDCKAQAADASAGHPSKEDGALRERYRFTSVPVIAHRGFLQDQRSGLTLGVRG